jgi:hypothetical protein
MSTITSRVIAGGRGARQAPAMLDRLAWLLLALLHAPPALALVRPAMIETLYGVTSDSPAFPLLQHRAALFVVVALTCLWAVADPRVRRLASVACALSMLSFLLLYWLAGTPPALRTIALADLLFLPVLAFAGWRAFRA